jgi:hypothetical protein
MNIKSGKIEADKLNTDLWIYWLHNNYVIYGISVFLLLAIFWYQTGRFFLIGWLVKIAWLPVNVTCFFLWIFTSFVNSAFNILRANFWFITALNVGLLVFCYISYRDNAPYFIQQVIATLVFFYLIKFGLDEGRVKTWITYSPQAKRTPALKPKHEHKKLKKAEIIAEELPFQTVKTLVRPQKDFETEAEIISNLDNHLQQLMKRV